MSENGGSQDHSSRRPGRMEHAIALMLRTGVMISAGIVLVGGLLYLLRHGHEVPDYHHFLGEPKPLRTLAGVIADVGTGSAHGLIQLGLMVLIATPVMRVVFSVGVFARQRDWPYVVITLMVLAILGLSLLLPA